LHFPIFGVKPTVPMILLSIRKGCSFIHSLCFVIYFSCFLDQCTEQYFLRKGFGHTSFIDMGIFEKYFSEGQPYSIQISRIVSRAQLI
jgi:hypothetical protein